MNNIGGPSMFRYEEAVKIGAIEQGIAPLCKALWDKGATPLSSCEGHPYKKSLFDLIMPIFSPVRPFVLFSSSVEIARALNELILKGVAGWTVSGSFNGKTNELVWVIEPSNIIYYRGEVTQKLINEDISRLVKCVNNW